MFDENGSLVLPKDAFAGIELPETVKVECPNCKHIIKARTNRHFTVCKRCHIEVRIR